MEHLPARLARWAESEPEDPWLFYTESIHWRWRSWVQVRDQAARAQSALAWLPEGAAVVFEGASSPDAMALDLAIQAAGLLAWPGGVPPEGAEMLRFPKTRSRLDRWVGEKLESREEPAAGVVLRHGDGWGRLDPAAVASLGLALDNLLTEPLARLRERPIALCGDPLSAWSGRRLYSWALHRGAALALVTREELIGAVLWTRPMVVQGDETQLSALYAALGTPSARRHGRLRAVIASEALTPEKVAASKRRWAERGITWLAAISDEEVERLSTPFVASQAVPSVVLATLPTE